MPQAHKNTLNHSIELSGKAVSHFSMNLSLQVTGRMFDYRSCMKVFLCEFVIIYTLKDAHARIQLCSTHSY